jgi:hypothetical protein
MSYLVINTLFLFIKYKECAILSGSFAVIDSGRHTQFSIEIVQSSHFLERENQFIQFSKTRQGVLIDQENCEFGFAEFNEVDRQECVDLRCGNTLFHQFSQAAPNFVIVGAVPLFFFFSRLRRVADFRFHLLGPKVIFRSNCWFSTRLCCFLEIQIVVVRLRVVT